MTDEPHAVVRLLLARMESHPEEFSNDDGRWAQWLDELMPFVTEKERVMLRKPMMQAIHEEVMDEMLNGEDRRRRKQEEENEYERHLAQAIRHTKMQAVQQGGGGGASLPVSTSPYSSGGGSILPVANGVTGATTIGGITGMRANSLVIDDPMLDSPTIEKIKRMLTRRSK